jgi:hypothetical protein
LWQRNQFPFRDYPKAKLSLCQGSSIVDDGRDYDFGHRAEAIDSLVRSLVVSRRGEANLRETGSISYRNLNAYACIKGYKEVMCRFIGQTLITVSILTGLASCHGRPNTCPVQLVYVVAIFL